jgi:hypothetical protein
MADAPTEARAREIIREEIGAALAAAMFGDPDMIAVYASGSIPPAR